MCVWFNCDCICFQLFCVLGWHGQQSERERLQRFSFGFPLLIAMFATHLFMGCHETSETHSYKQSQLKIKSHQIFKYAHYSGIPFFYCAAYLCFSIILFLSLSLSFCLFISSLVICLLLYLFHLSSRSLFVTRSNITEICLGWVSTQQRMVRCLSQCI